MDAEQAAAFAKADFLDAQAFEIDFHMRNKWRQSSAFLQSSKRIFRSWGFALDAFSGKVVIDVGAGSRGDGGAPPFYPVLPSISSAAASPPPDPPTAAPTSPCLRLLARSPRPSNRS